jgi:integrase
MKAESKRPRGTGSKFLRGRVWYVKYYRDGRPFVESAHTDNARKADRLLQQRISAVASGEFISPSDRRITVKELFDGLLDNYRMKEKATLRILESKWKLRLGPFFERTRASQVSTDLLTQYVLKCRADGLENATINRDMSALRRAFSLGYKCTPRKVQQIPIFPDRLTEAPPRQGFVDQREFDLLCKHAGELWLRALLATAYEFGFRRGELLAMRVHQIDLFNRTIRLYRGETKSGEPRTIRMTGDVYVLLRECVAGKSTDAHVFTRNGNPIVDIRDAWNSMCAKAGLTGVRLHDLRRSAIRNMIRRGVPERVAMEISGHETRSVFDRYNIVSETDLSRAAEQIEQGKRQEREKLASEFGVQFGVQSPRSVA